MRRFRFIGSNKNYFWDIKPVTGIEYFEDELRKMFGNGWECSGINLEKLDWEEVPKYESVWISVKKQKPQEGEKVLFFSKRRGYSIGCFYKEMWLTPNEISKYFPTHWMPLPKPPVK